MAGRAREGFGGSRLFRALFFCFSEGPKKAGALRIQPHGAGLFGAFFPFFHSEAASAPLNWEL